MPQRPKIYQLPDTVKAELDRRLISGGFCDYVALSAWLADAGYEISKSAINRYGQEFEQRLSAIKIATEQARAIGEAAGDDAGNMNDALVRLCQEKAFQVLVKMQDPEPDSVDINKMGIMISRLTRASVTQKKWMAEVKEKTKATAEDVVKTVRAGGLSAEKAETIRKQILGIL